MKSRAVRAVASWTCLSLAIAPGPLAARIAIASPMPDRDGDQHQRDDAEGAAAIQKRCWPGSV